MTPLAPSSGRGFSAPIATRLLPPSASPRLAAEPGGSDDALAAAASRAGRQALRLAGRAAAAAREHGPEAEQRARRAAALAGSHAVRLASDAAARARETLGDAPRREVFLTAHRRRLGWVAAALGAAAVAAVAAASLGGGEAAQTKAEAALDAYGLRPALRYRSISTSLFGAVTLSGVAVEVGGLTITADAVRVARIAMNGDAPRAIRLAVDRATLPVLEAARQSMAPVLRQAVGLGYTSLRADLTLDISFDDAARVLSVKLAGAADALGSWSAEASIRGVTSAGAADALHTTEALSQARRPGGSEEAVQRLTGILTQATLRDATLRLDDGELFRRMAQIPREEVPYHPDESGGVASPMPEAAQQTVAAVRPAERATAERALRRWIEHGGRLTMSLSPIVPLPLFRPDPFGTVAPASGEPGFLSEAGLRIDL